jgi:adenosylcobyric acid synthase
MALLPPEEKQLIKGIIINKFRGDARLFDTGRTMLEDICGVPVVGIIPYRKDIYVEEEDSVGLEHKHNKLASGKVNVAVILLNRLSNFTDFNVLEQDERVHLFYSNNPADIEKADIIILPGSKNTIADLIDIKNNGVAKAIVQAHKNRKTVIGICGGYQMMGSSIEDPHHVEGTVEAMPGLGILPVKTILTENKVTEQCRFYYKGNAAPCNGYEIHMGISTATGPERPLNKTATGNNDGYALDDRCWGTYIHGILDNAVVIDDLLKAHTSQQSSAPFDYIAFKEAQYDKLAQHLREHIDMEYIYGQLKNGR